MWKYPAPMQSVSSMAAKPWNSFIAALLSVTLLTLTPGCERKVTSKHEEFGVLTLPLPQRQIDSSDLGALLIGVRISPMGQYHLNPADRKAFLIYLQQVLAIVELPSTNDIYFSRQAPIWSILVTNFPESKTWVDAATTKTNMVAVKQLAPQILELDL